METLRITVEGMSCSHCVEAVRSTLSSLDGVTVDQVTIGEAVVRFDPRRASAEQICDEVSEIGYLAYRAAPVV